MGNHKKDLINKISWIIFNPIGKFFTVAYKVPQYRRLTPFVFFSVDSLNTSNIQIVTTFLTPLSLKMVCDLIMVLQLIYMFKTLNKFKVFVVKSSFQR